LDAWQLIIFALSEALKSDRLPEFIVREGAWRAESIGGISRIGGLVAVLVCTENLIRVDAVMESLPEDFRYENGLMVANGDYVVLHGRFSGIGLPASCIVADIVRLENGKLAEHWDVIQDEVKKEASRSGLPMFGDKFPA
jgi:hypothetical protein